MLDRRPKLRDQGSSHILRSLTAFLAAGPAAFAAAIASALGRPLYRAAAGLTIAVVSAVVAASLVPGLPDQLARAVDVGADRSAAEFLEYGLTAGAALALFLAARGERSADRLLWGLLFLILTADNALLLHERAGARIGSALFGANPDARHFGQAIFLAGVYGPIFLALLARAARAGVRETAPLALLALVYAGFGGVADAAAHFVPGAISKGFALVEDRGEMMAIAAVFLYALALAVRVRPQPR